MFVFVDLLLLLLSVMLYPVPIPYVGKYSDLAIPKFPFAIP